MCRHLVNLTWNISLGDKHFNMYRFLSAIYWSDMDFSRRFKIYAFNMYRLVTFVTLSVNQHVSRIRTVDMDWDDSVERLKRRVS